MTVAARVRGLGRKNLKGAPNLDKSLQANQVSAGLHMTSIRLMCWISSFDMLNDEKVFKIIS